MPSNKKKPAAKMPGPIRWEFDPDIPIHDFLDEQDALADGLNDTVRYFLDWLEEGTFLTWEKVVCEEHGLPFTGRQKKALGGLLDFNDDKDDDGSLYIDEMPRPSEPWYLILNKIAPHLTRSSATR